ncbi:sensor histidine kinase [Pseudonocardia charpentierae]|uniref:histidine kinase n=1 Tax=Pseudonocardia charpentierae TaxID=3075545 RepID=A0ABU2N9V8_9PSEU|nr:ATP-binding protein [Pseudonocardia sp. DSM 45834]MDT0350732.1 ATP-binding protein [Pseudonocardia sp. DSM 45834]
MTLTDRPSPPPSTELPALAVPNAPMVDPRGRDGRDGQTQTLRRTFAAGAGVTVLIMLVAILASSVSLGRLTNARQTLLDDIGPAVRANQSLEVALLNQETSIRGYALTRAPDFLTPYRDSISDEAAAMATLRGYFAGRPEEAQVDELGRAVEAWRSGYAEPVAAATDVAPAPDPTTGKALFDRVRVLQGDLTRVLDGQRVEARDQLNDAADALRWVGIAIALVIVAFLAAAAWGLRRGVLDPLAELADQVRGVVSGDVHREVRGSGPREIVALGADIDAMRVHISNEVDLLQEVNQRLDEQAQDLERSNRDLEQFAYVASHDLQEPLRKVSSFCQLLQRRYGGQLDERADQYIGFAVDGAQRMQRLINDLLAFSRVGRSTAAFETVDMREIALAAAAQVETTRSELDGEIVVGDLPRVQGDPALLRQLLLNLFGNGLKFHRPDVAPVVRIDAHCDGEHWEFAVTDNGIGVEPEYAEKIFVIFQRLHGRDLYTGTGIGLALVKKIAEFHGGRVWLDATPRDEPGTVIRFTLPVEEVAEPAIPAIPATSVSEEKS